MSAVTAILPWYGSKRTLASRIVSALGPHRAYWEPFCGSAAVLIAKPVATMETVNDLHGDLIHMIRIMQHSQLRPAFAVGCAHWRHVRVRIGSDGGAEFLQRVPNIWFGDRRTAWHRHIVLPPGVLPEPMRKFRDLEAVVPLIPANLRPMNALNRYVLLWEAVWVKRPPIDPLLLRHLHGSLYAVFAAWDLTPLERAVLAGRLNDRN